MTVSYEADQILPSNSFLEVEEEVEVVPGYPIPEAPTEIVEPVGAQDPDTEFPVRSDVYRTSQRSRTSTAAQGCKQISRRR